MKFDPTTGKEITEQNISIIGILESIQPITNLLSLVFSIIAIVIAYKIYKKWTRDESVKLLMADTQKLKREAYILAATRINASKDLIDEILKDHGRGLRGQSVFELVENLKERTLLQKEYEKKAFLYESKKDAILDEIEELGGKIERPNKGLECGFQDDMIEFGDQLDDCNNSTEQRVYRRESIDRLSQKIKTLRKEELSAIIKISDFLKDLNNFTKL